MARRAFFSFHFKPDNWRASQVRSIGAIEGNRPVSDNAWEEVKKDGDQAIKNWIAGQMKGRSCTIVLVGSNTAGRKWINYEIEKSWKDRKGIVGICIHNLQDSNQAQSIKGKNPFDSFTIGGTKMSSIVKLYDPPYSKSTNVYNHICENIEAWCDEAVNIRNKY